MGSMVDRPPSPAGRGSAECNPQFLRDLPGKSPHPPPLVQDSFYTRSGFSPPPFFWAFSRYNPPLGRPQLSYSGAAIVTSALKARWEPHVFAAAYRYGVTEAGRTGSRIFARFSDISFRACLSEISEPLHLGAPVRGVIEITESGYSSSRLSGRVGGPASYTERRRAQPRRYPENGIHLFSESILRLSQLSCRNFPNLAIPTYRMIPQPCCVKAFGSAAFSTPQPPHRPPP